MESFGLAVDNFDHQSDISSDDEQMPMIGLAASPRSRPLFALDNGTMRSGLSGTRRGLRDRQHNFSKLFQALRYDAGLTLQQVADAVGVSKPTVWAWENGRAKPGREKLHTIAQTLGVAPDLLVNAARKRPMPRPMSSEATADLSHRDALIAEGRALIAKAYEVAPSVVRIFVEVEAA